MALGLLLVAVLLLFSLNEFSSGGGGGSATAGGGATGTPSILSRSQAEAAIKLCAEGRPSTYGNPPTSAQQARCVRMLLGEISATGSTIAGGP
jgi:hypothetical protein